jgi:hypothetical protein
MGLKIVTIIRKSMFWIEYEYSSLIDIFRGEVLYGLLFYVLH